MARGWFEFNVLFCIVEGSFVRVVEVPIVEGVSTNGTTLGVWRRFLSSLILGHKCVG
jgi:hypothetical protein